MQHQQIQLLPILNHRQPVLQQIQQRVVIPQLYKAAPIPPET